MNKGSVAPCNTRKTTAIAKLGNGIRTELAAKGNSAAASTGPGRKCAVTATSIGPSRADASANTVTKKPTWAGESASSTKARANPIATNSVATTMAAPSTSKSGRARPHALAPLSTRIEVPVTALASGEAR